MAFTSNPIAANVGPLSTPGGSPFARVGTGTANIRSNFGPRGNVIPNVVITGRGVVPRDALLPSQVPQQQVNVAAIGAPISLVYGRNRIAGKIMQPVLMGANLLIPMMLGAGEIQALDAVEFDNKTGIPGGVSYTFYPGNQTQNPDPWLVTAWGARGITYADNLRGIAYVVLNVPNLPEIQFQNVAFIVRGLKVYDPRDGTQVLATPTTWKYSNNAALVLAHFLNAPGIGPEDTMNWTSVGAMADIDDQLCGTGAQQEKRRTIGITFDQAQDIDSIEGTLRAHAGCWVVREAGVTRLVPDAPATSIFHFTKGKYRLDSVQIKARGRGRSPTVVTVQYTDTTSSPWKPIDFPQPSKVAGVDAGTVPWIESQVQMPGIQQPGQAFREQVRRLNEFTLSDLEVVFVALDEGAKVMTGDVFLLSDTEGFVAKPFRCTDAHPIEAGRWMISGSEYQDAVYSDAPANGAGIPDTNLPDLLTLPQPGPITITPVVYLERSNAGPIATGFIYQTRADVVVTPPVYAYPFSYRWELLDGTLKIDDKVTDGPAYSTPPLQQGKTYTINCFARSLYGPESATPATGSFTAQGKTTPPGPIAAIINAQEIGGDVHLAWTPPTGEADVLRYEWRYTPNQTVGGSWAAATLIDRVDGLTATFSGLPVGTHRFYGASIDSAGNYSTSFVTVDVNITSDTNAFLQSKIFAPRVDSTELCTNGDFASSTGWTPGTGFTISGGALNVAYTGAGTGFASRAAAQSQKPNTWYLVQFQITAFTAGGVYVSVGGGSGTSVVGNAVGTFRSYVKTSASPDGNLYVTANANPTTATVDNVSVIEVGLVNMIAYPAIEGAWTDRWVTSVPGQTFNAAITGTVNAVATPIAQIHGSDISRFIGETWDLGVSVSGDWTLTPNATVINGGITVGIETSPDAITWTFQPGLSFKGSARAARPVIFSNSGADTFRIDAKPKIALSALARAENNLVTTLASGGLLVQLAGQYAIVKNLQNAAVNTSADRRVSTDRILVYPQQGLMLVADTTAGDAFAIQNISSAAYTIVSGDFLEYDVFIDPNAPAVTTLSDGGMTLVFSDASTTSALNDADGFNCVQPAVGFDPLARGMWKSRKIPLTSKATLGVTTWRIRIDSDGVGKHKVLFRNIRITDGGATTRVTAYNTTGEPTVNTSFASALATNVMCGPANSYLLYAFGPSGQVAQDVQSAFEGI